MRKIFLFFAVLLFPVVIFGQEAKVMAWNLGGFDPIPQIRVTNHVRAIRSINPDIIVLSEVNPDSVATDIAGQLGGYTAVILEQSATQNLAILYKSSNCLVDARLIPGSDDGNNRLRKAVTARVQIGKFDFVIVGVHMKAGRRTSNVNTNPVPVRNRQAQAIERYIGSVMALGEKDILLVGDYNMIPGLDTTTFKLLSPGSGANEQLLYLSDDFTGQASHIGSCDNNQASGNLLDGFAISKNFTREYVDDSIKLISFTDTSVFTGENNVAYTCANYLGLVSDHFPFVASFKTNLPDDD